MAERNAVVNPRVTTDLSVDCASPDSIIASLVRAGMSDEKKVLAVFHWVRRVIYHGDGAKKYAYQFNRMVNVFGHGSCARQTGIMALLLGKMGYRTQNWTREGHHLMQVYYGGQWHCFDPHMNFYVFDRSKPPVIASVEQLQKDPTLSLSAVKEGRAGPGFLLCGDSPKTFAGEGKWERHGEYPDGFRTQTYTNTFGGIILRRGESYVRTWKPGQYWFLENSYRKDGGPYHGCGGRDRKDTVNWPLYEPHAWQGRYRHWGAGQLVYHPKFSTDAWVDGTALTMNLQENGGTLLSKDGKNPCVVVFTVNCPYVITAGELTTKKTGQGIIQPSISVDQGKTWRPVMVKPANPEAVIFVEEVNGSFEGYWLKLSIPVGTALADIRLVSHFQLNPYSLPHLVPGKNRISVAVEKKGAPLIVTYRWAEGPEWKTSKMAERTCLGNDAFEIGVSGPKYPRMESLTLSVPE